MKKDIKEGMGHSIPIALGYFPVSFTFGLIAVSSGLNPMLAFAISLTNFTSAGQFAGMNIMIAGGTYIEMAVTMLVINLRYMLMSFSLSQKMKGFGIIDRLITGFGVTDEIFAVSSIEKDEISPSYMRGLIFLPYIGWSMGTLLGALISGVLPERLKDSMGIALYGMFLAIIIPVAKQSPKVLKVILIAVAMSCAFYYTPVLKEVPQGWMIIITTVAASAIGALLFPEVNSDDGD